jgi:hypothetical protein
MANNYFRPLPGRFGIQVEQSVIGNPGPISPVAVASSTVTYKRGLPVGKYFVEKIGYFIGTLAAGSLAITAQVFRRNSVGAVNQALTAAFDLKAGSINTNLAVAISATEQNRYFAPGDYVAVDLVAAGTITTQPADLFVTVELAVRE